jgi:hypothetical protein
MFRCGVLYLKVKRKCFSVTWNAFTQSWPSLFRSDQAAILEMGPAFEAQGPVAVDLYVERKRCACRGVWIGAYRLCRLCSTMSALGHSRPSHFVPVLNNVRYASDSDHSRYESELTLWAMKRREQVQQ